MTTDTKARLLLLAALGLALSACSNQPGTEAEGTAAPAAGATADLGASAPMTGAVEAGTPMEPTVPVGQISSGTVQPGPTSTEPVRPTQAGNQRPVPLATAIASVPFPVLAPQEFPGPEHLDVVHLREPREGEDATGLPAVRLIYSIEPNGSIVINESAATGAEGEGEAIDVAGNAGWIQESGDAIVVTWEQDGVRIELRGSRLTREQVLAAAASVGPADPAADA
jgi:hypothetical protein